MLKRYIQLLDKLLPSLIGIPFFYSVVLEFRNHLESKLPEKIK